MAKSDSRVEIGFLEKSESFKLESRFFPSKVGGQPAWLDLSDISVDISCGVCDKPCIFLCQVYAPVEGQNNAYHRTIFIFVCRNPECCDANKNNNFVVFRCQLPRENDFYVSEEPDDTPNWHPECKIDKFSPTCIVCGCLGSYHCGKCKTARYCSQEHQVLDWKSGHKDTCGSNKPTFTSQLLFPEYEILTEPETLDLPTEIGQEKSDEEKLREYEELLQTRKPCNIDIPDSIMEELVESKEDKYFKKFKSVLSKVPDQIIRYERGGQPLWIAKPNLIEESVPKCELCHSPRQFEFQVLPTLLAYLNVDSLSKSIDWGTLIIYTCKKNCVEGPAYKREYLWKQDVL